MTDYDMISMVNHHMGVVYCERCGHTMGVLRGVSLPFTQARKDTKSIKRTLLFAEIQCSNCSNIRIFRKIV